jgi:hypothetical protein
MAWIEDSNQNVLLVRQAAGFKLWTLPGGNLSVSRRSHNRTIAGSGFLLHPKKLLVLLRVWQVLTKTFIRSRRHLF